MEEQNTPEFRFARYVSPTAPKVGHQLATVSFQRGNEMTIFWVIEGAQNDEVSALGMATDFERTRLWSFSFSGSLIERLNQVSLSPYAQGAQFRLVAPGNGSSPLPIQQGTVEFSNVRAVNRADPDSAIVAYQLSDPRGDEQIMAAITGYQRGWFLIIVIIFSGLGISSELDPSLVDGQAVPVSVEIDQGVQRIPIRVEGSVAFRASLIGR